jgi:hypothetical protein
MHKKGTKQGGEAGYQDPAGFIGTFICPFAGLRVLAGEVAKIVEDRNKDCLIAAIKNITILITHAGRKRANGKSHGAHVEASSRDIRFFCLWLPFFAVPTIRDSRISD